MYSDLKFQYSIKIQFKPRSISSSISYILVGCPDCNSGRGKVDIYKAAIKVGEVSGETDNMQMGTDIVELND